MSEIQDSIDEVPTQNESLSALMDGEASELELRRILKNSKDDGSVLETWEKYHYISAVIKQERHSRHPVNLLQKVRHSLAEEPTPSVTAVKSHSFKNLLKNISQGAVAAGVAVAVLLVSNVGSDSTVNMSDSLLSSDSSQQAELPVLNGDYTVSQFSRMASFDEEMDDATKNRLKEAVYRELDNETDLPVTMVNYSAVE